ncbi:hypothetical protein HK101_002835 [Irineochytrium annulatum]|nr:hypothetical protein HK101_002835 [Irineochytrium annulatum]
MASLQSSMENLNGRMGHLAPDQESTLAQFKKELADEGYYDPEKHDDHLLLRFLRARKFQLPLAKQMFIACEDWRKEYGTATLRDTLEFPEYPIVKKFYPRYYHKTDKLGRPLYVEKFGVLDVTQLFSVTTDERMLKNHVYEYEKLVQYRLPACALKAGRHLEQSCVIMDLKGVSLSMFPSIYGIVKKVSSIAQDYYPEMLGKMFVINAPMLFSGVYSVCKPMLDEVTVNKIYIMGSNYKSQLLEFIDADCLPEYMGGTCKCEGGCENSDVGPWNDGTVEGFPKEVYEKFEILYGSGDINRHMPNAAELSTLARTGTILHVLIILFAVISSAVYTAYWRLPSAVETLHKDGVPHFSESVATRHVKALAEEIGTKGEEEAREYVVRVLKEIKAEAEKIAPELSFDILTERGFGSHRFDFMGEVVMKQYVNISSVVVKLSCGPTCDQNAILVNSHLDSQIVTPGAADDAAGVAVMLEMARVVSHSNRPLRNALILLFNGAEETLQDASHAFVTASPLAKNVKAFVNLEGMGNSGKEILFQANSMQMVDRGYRYAPYPHGSVCSNDIFQTGLVLSDTDFRQFVDYGKLIGIDMAFYVNSYVYHTMLDVVENFRPGFLQHVGDNTVAIIQQLLVEPIEDFKEGRDFIYWDLFGTYFFVYTWQTADFIHGVILVLAILSSFRPILVQHYSNTERTTSLFARSLPLMRTIGAVLFSIVFAALWPAVIGAVMQFAAGRPMTYFRAEWMAIMLFLPSSFAAIVGSQLLTRIFIKGDPLDTLVDYERRIWASVTIWQAVAMSILSIFRLGSAFLLAITTASFILGLFVDRILTRASRTAPMGSRLPIHSLSYVIAVIGPFAFTAHYSLMALYLFVPLTGRIGKTAPVDVIVGALVGILSLLGYSILMPLAARVSRRRLFRSWVWTATMAILVCVAMALTSFPYDGMHPKRVFVQYSRNATSGDRSIQISHSDPPHADLIVDSISKAMDLKPRLQMETENARSWGVLFPFSEFIESHEFDVKSIIVEPHNDPAAPMLFAKNISYDEKLGLRTLTVVCSHPEYIFTVVEFDADVTAWSLSAEPRKGHHKHIIRYAGGYGTSMWNTTLTVRASSIDDRLKLHLTVGKRGQKPGAELAWMWGEGFNSAKILQKVQDAMPSWTTELYLAVVNIAQEL